METPTPAPVAAEPVAAPEKISASVDAVNRDDFDAFDRAELGKLSGAPVADVPVSAEPIAPAETRKTRAEKDQARINESIRVASEATSAPLKARIAELEAQLHRPLAETPRPAADPGAAVAPPTGTPEYKRLMALPGAPKLDEYDSVAEHAFAVGEFIDATRTKEREATARSHRDRDARFAAEQAADDAFFAQLDKAKEADVEFTKKLSPDVLGLTPIEWVPRDAQGHPLDKPGGARIELGPLHVVGSELRKSPVVSDLFLHFSQHPDDLKKFAEMPAAVAAIRDPDARLQAHVRHIVREFHRLEGRFMAASADPPAAPASAAAVVRSPITAAPPPPPTLRAAGNTSDPKASALARDDFAEYDRLETQERMAKRTPLR